MGVMEKLNEILKFTCEDCGKNKPEDEVMIFKFVLPPNNTIVKWLCVDCRKTIWDKANDDLMKISKPKLHKGDTGLFKAWWKEDAELLCVVLEDARINDKCQWQYKVREAGNESDYVKYITEERYIAKEKQP